MQSLFPNVVFGAYVLTWGHSPGQCWAVSMCWQRTLGLLSTSRDQATAVIAWNFFAICQFTHDLYHCIVNLGVSSCPTATNGSYLLLLYRKSQKATSTYSVSVWRMKAVDFFFFNRLYLTLCVCVCEEKQCKAVEKWAKMNKSWISRVGRKKNYMQIHIHILINHLTNSLQNPEFRAVRRSGKNCHFHIFELLY